MHTSVAVYIVVRTIRQAVLHFSLHSAPLSDGTVVHELRQAVRRMAFIKGEDSLPSACRIGKDGNYLVTTTPLL